MNRLARLFLKASGKDPDLKAVGRTMLPSLMFWPDSKAALQVSILEKTVPELGLCTLLTLLDDYSTDESDV